MCRGIPVRPRAAGCGRAGTVTRHHAVGTGPPRAGPPLREALSGVAVTHSTINSRSVPCGDHRLQVQGFSDGVECVSGVVTKDFREEPVIEFAADRIVGQPGEALERLRF